MKDYIVVNATALDTSGALSILKQFIENIPNDNHSWLVFTSEKIILSPRALNINLQPIKGVKSMPRRFWWDAIGLNLWLKKNDVNPIASVSLQNTGFHVSKKIPQFIYYHQSLPFYPYKWNPLKRTERLLWFYKNIYPFFVKLFLKKDTVVFTQLEYIKKGFLKKFNHTPDKVEIYSPAVTKEKLESINDINLSENINLFYPATGHFYKNHSVVYKALKKLEGKATLYVTIPTDEKYVKSTGVLPFEDVCEMYHQCDALVFPSYIETFGLPLLEAAQTGLPIIAADLPYAREVLKGYEGVIYVKYDDSSAWAKAIEKIEKGKRFTHLDISSRPGWKDLFSSIESSL